MPDTNSGQVDNAANGIDEKEQKRTDEFQFKYDCLVKDGEIIYSIEGIEVFRGVFNPENYAQAFFKKLKPSEPFLTISEDQRRRLYAGVREASAKEGKEISDEELSRLEPEGLYQLSLKLLMQSIENATKRVADNLPQIVTMIFQRVLYATFYAGANDLRDIVEVPEQKFSAKEIRDAIFQPEWERIKNLAGVAHGGARPRKAKFVWDAEKALKFYQTVEALPRHGADKLPMWEYAREVLRDFDYDYETIQFLMKRPMFSDVQEELLKEAAKVWRQYDENWNSLPPESSPQAFAFRHACAKLGFPYTTYNTARTNYYKGKKASEGKS
jgi:hypothetical protein